MSGAFFLWVVGQCDRAEVSTVVCIVRVMGTNYGPANRVRMLNRSMVSEANIAFLRQRKARYLAGI